MIFPSPMAYVRAFAFIFAAVVLSGLSAKLGLAKDDDLFGRL